MKKIENEVIKITKSNINPKEIPCNIIMENTLQ